MLMDEIKKFLIEDGLFHNDFYRHSLPQTMVHCSLKFKSDLIIAGLPYFFNVFRFLMNNEDPFDASLRKFEGQEVKAPLFLTLHFSLPFDRVLNGERVALNLLQRASSVATYTKKFVDQAKKYNIAILDTRKTTPGLRSLEKYAVRVGGGANHRFSQTDMWMIKDNHKEYFGGLQQAYDYFVGLGQFYAPIIVEIHHLDELKQGLDLNIRHFLLDNFAPKDVEAAIKLKPQNKGVTYEISGGIQLENMDRYLMEGVDALSVGGLTYNPPPVDISLKYKK